MRHKLFILLGFFFLFNVVHCQYSISGKVTDVNGAAIAFADVVLYKSDDSSFLKGGITNEDGVFNLDNLFKGKYQLQIQRLGSKNLEKDLIINNTSIDLGILILQEDIEFLNTVTIIGDKKAIRHERGKTVIQIDGTSKSKELTISRALETLPGISIAPESKEIEILGKSNVTIWVNGKPSKLSISSLPASIVSEVEIIHNPGAKYGADTDAIINVKLDKWKNNGFFGEVYTALTQGRYFNIYDGFSAAYNKNKVNINTQFYHASNKTFLKRELEQEFILESPATFLTSSEFRKIKQDYYYIYTDLGLDITDTDLLGVKVEYGRSWDPYRRIRLTDTFYTNTSQQTRDSLFDNKTNIRNLLHEFGAGASYQKKWEKANVQLDFNYFRTHLDQDQNYVFDQSNFSSQLSQNSQFDRKELNETNLFGFLANPSFSLKDKTMIDIGVEYSYTDTTFESSFLGDTDYIVSDFFDFDAKEFIYAAFLEVSKKIGVFSLTAGARFEHSDGEGIYGDVDRNFRIPYQLSKLFPSGLTRKIHCYS